MSAISSAIVVNAAPDETQEESTTKSLVSNYDSNDNGSANGNMNSDSDKKMNGSSDTKTGSADKEKDKDKKEQSKTTIENALELNRDLFVALYGCELINQAGIMLQTSQVVIATAQVVFHRFYKKKKRSVKDFPPFHVAMACVYLATKVEEEKRRHRDILNVFDRLQKKRAGKVPNVLDPYGKRYSKWKNVMMKLELNILCDLGYILKVEHPHKFILNYINVLDAGEKVAQKAWSYLNDSLRIPKIIEIKPEVMACSAIFLAARKLQVKLPDNPAWYELFDATRDEIERVSRMICELYKVPKHHFEKLDSGLEVDLDDDIDALKDMSLPTAPKKTRPSKPNKKSPKESKTKQTSPSASDSDGADKKKGRHRSRSREKRKRKSRRKRSRQRSRSRSDSRSPPRKRKRHKRRYSISPSVGSSRSRSRERRRKERRRRR